MKPTVTIKKDACGFAVARSAQFVKYKKNKRIFEQYRQGIIVLFIVFEIFIPLKKKV